MGAAAEEGVGLAEAAPENIEAMLVTFDTSQLLVSGLAEPASANIWLILVTAEVSPPAEPAPARSEQLSIYDDPMFGPIKRLLVELVGEG